MTIESQATKIIVAPDPQALDRQGAAYFERTLADAVAKNGRASVAISGGSTPRGMNRLLAEPPLVERIPWHGIDLFWVDDRMVPCTDPASNYGAAREDFITRVPIPESQVHPMPAADPPMEGAKIYTAELQQYFGNSRPVFDLVFLGIGDDGHTASLFPDQADAHTGPEWVLCVKGGNPDVHRLTLNYPILNLAADTVVLVRGQDKADIVHSLLCGEPERYPPQKIQPQNGPLVWMLDQAAASRLPREMIT